MTERDRDLVVLAIRVGTAVGYAALGGVLRAGGLTPRELVATTVAGLVALIVVLGAGWVANGARDDH